MKRFFYISLIFFLWSSTAAEEVIFLSEGLQYNFILDESFEGKQIKFEGTYRQYTQLEYDSPSRTILFSPQKVGTGTLHLKEGKQILKKYTVTVRQVDLNRMAHEIESLLSEISGITIKVLNNKVIVDGEISTPRDMKRIYSVVTEYGSYATSLVSLSAAAQNKLALFMEQEIGHPEITVRAANGKFILRGTVSKIQERVEAERIAELYAPSVVSERAVREGAVQDRNIKDIIINLIQVEPAPKEEKTQKKLIQLVFHYIELDKNYDNFFRFQFAPGIEDDTLI